MAAGSPPRPLGRRAAAAGVAAVLVVLLGACSGGKDNATPVSPTFTVPEGTGDHCTDPTGDLDVPAGVDPSTPGLAGIDLTAASALVQGKELAIEFHVAGSVEAAPDPTYVVAQGDPLQPLSFELRTEHTSQGWVTTLITWPSGVEQRRQLPITPQVSGSTVSLSVSLDQLPPIGQVLQFGTNAKPTPGAVVVDVCSSLGGG